VNAPPAKDLVPVISACMTRAGLPELALSEVEVTPEEYENGVHYALAERRLFAAGYEEPFVHFAGPEAPAFLLPAVRRHVGVSGASDNPNRKEE
jgi:hypothetical protein